MKKKENVCGLFTKQEIHEIKHGAIQKNQQLLLCRSNIQAVENY